MNACRRLERRADLWLSESLSAPRRRALERHLARCDECRGLDAALRDASASVDLVVGWRQRGSGACEQARLRLVAPATADELGDRLVRDHVDSCAPCARFAEALVLADRTLPTLASLDPGPEFTRDVLALTTAHSGASDQSAVDSRWERVRSWCLEQAARPRFAAEFSYAAMLALVLLFGTPVSPFRSLPPTLLGWYAEASRGGDELPPGWVDQGILPVATAPVRLVAQGGAISDKVGDRLGERRDQVSPALSSLGGHLGEIGSRVTEREWEGLRPLWGEMQCDLSLLWRGVRGRLEDPGERDCERKSV